MPISGKPAWGEFPSVENMGGGVAKKNYLEAPVNPETDVDVSQYNLLCQSAAQTTRTSLFAVLNAVLGSSPSVSSYRAQHAVGANLAPTITEQATGHYRLAWSSSYSDEFGQSAPINLVDCSVQVHGATPLITQPLRVDASTMDIYVFDMSSVAYGSDVTVTISVGVSS